MEKDRKDRAYLILKYLFHNLNVSHLRKTETLNQLRRGLRWGPRSPRSKLESEQLKEPFGTLRVGTRYENFHNSYVQTHGTSVSPRGGYV